MRIFLISVLFFAGSADAETFLDDYYSAVFRGDLSWVEGSSPVSDDGMELKKRFIATFVRQEQDESLSEIEDELARSLAEIHQNYWRAALLEPDFRERAEAKLQADIKGLLIEHIEYSPNDDGHPDLTSLLRQRGYEYRGGRTAPLLDFMLWRNSRRAVYEVTLTDGDQTVTVHFLEDFLVRGWSHFATFGRSSTGGWADADALYCVEEAYDVQSENFQISYLRHEARHFADYRMYPKLKSADLEYRAKLTELVYSSDQRSIMRRFAANASGVSNSPHTLANWHVVKEVSSLLTANVAMPDLEYLSKTEGKSISQAARSLLQLHDETLGNLGSEITKGSIMSLEEADILNAR